MQTTSKIRLGLIGESSQTSVIAQAARNCRSARLIATAGISAETISRLSMERDCAHYGRAEEMLRIEQLDAVVLCTPAAAHSRLCRFLFERNVSVLCEQPLSVDTRSAQQLLQLARVSHQQVISAVPERFAADVIQVQEVLETGLLGDLSGIEIHSAAPQSLTHFQDGGAILDLGWPALELVRLFLGSIDQVQAQRAKSVQSLSHADTVRIETRSHGVPGAITLCRTSIPGGRREVLLRGTAGELNLSPVGVRFRKSPESRWMECGAAAAPVQTWQTQLDHFAHLVQGEMSAASDVSAGLAAVETLEAVYAGLANGRWESTCRTSALPAPHLELRTLTSVSEAHPVSVLSAVSV